jgi:predicted flap endonuclease-1-like 5' DNA nuclease
LKGIGKKLEVQLNKLGIYNFSQIAEWDDKDIENIKEKIPFHIKIDSDDWVGQAKLLMNQEKE